MKWVLISACISSEHRIDFVTDFTLHKHSQAHDSISFSLRNGKPKNRPSFQQVLLHVEIAAGDVLKTPQEVYLNQQVGKPRTAFAAPQKDHNVIENRIFNGIGF